MKLNRFRSSEITSGRVYEAARRRILEVPHTIAWNGGGRQVRENRRRLERFRGKYVGRRCFILGNGASLTKMDLSPLRNEITFGLNRIYLLFDSLGFVPTFFVCVNELVLEQFMEDIESIRIPKFLNWNRRGLFDPQIGHAMYLRLALGIRDFFGDDPTKAIGSGGTVTYVAMQLAFFLGFSEAIIIGVDHAYSDRGIPNKPVVRNSDTDRDHFHPQYFPRGIKWQPPDLLRSEISYALARDAYERAGRKILDATLDGKCPVFEKIEFTNLFN